MSGPQTKTHSVFVMKANQSIYGFSKNPIRDIPNLVIQVKEELARIKDKGKNQNKKKKFYIMKAGNGESYKL